MAAAVTGCGPDVEPRDAALEVRAYGCPPANAARVGRATAVSVDRALTVAHTVAGAERLEVVDSRGRTRSATLVAFDPRSDLAVLAVDAGALPADVLPAVVALARREPGAGATGVLYAQRPVAVEVLRRATVEMADIYGEGSSSRSGFELSARVEPGASGAGLLIDGRLAGVLFAASSRRGERAWATGLAEVRAVLAEARAGRPVDSGDCRARASSEPVAGHVDQELGRASGEHGDLAIRVERDDAGVRERTGGLGRPVDARRHERGVVAR